MSRNNCINNDIKINRLYPPQFIPKDNYGAKLISFETHNRFLKIFSRKQLNPKFVKKKLNIFEKLLKCCGEEEEVLNLREIFLLSFFRKTLI